MLAANLRSWERPKLFYFHFMLAESAVLGAFLAQDLALFVAFFDLMLIPFYFLIGGWGREPDRVKATIKLVIYTLVGSLLMLAAAIATGVLASEQGGGHITFVLTALQALPLSKGSQEWIFLFFAAAFLVKMPAFPLHGWMPDGYRAMPIEVLMVFSGVLSKVGAYGFLAIVLPLFPQAAAHFQTLMLLIALASIIYGSALAFTQTDARLIAGYSSVAQLGFITLGIFALNPQGAQGALLQMVNHGLVVAPLFFIIALLSRRAGGSEDIREMGGIAFRAPVLATLFLIVALATLAMPGSSNFVGEFLILLGVFKAKLAIAIIAFTGVVMASVYALRLFIRAMHNRVGPKVESREISVRDGLVLVPLVAVILFLALYPQLALHRSEGSVKSAVFEAQALAHNPDAAVPLLRRHGEHRRDREHRTMNHVPHRRSRARHRHPERPARRLRRALAADRAARRRRRGAARRPARPSGARAGGARAQPGRARRRARPDDLAVERSEVDRRRGAADRRAVARAEHDPDRRRRGDGAARVALARGGKPAHGECHALLLTSIAGMFLLASAQNTVLVFVGLELLSIPLYVLCATDMQTRPARGALAGVGAEVPDHRLGRLGDAALRPRADLRRDRRDRLLRDRRRALDRQPRDRPADADGDRAVRRRPLLQGLGRALPPVDPRRLRGRADADHGVHGGRHEGRRARRVPAPLRRRPDQRPARAGARRWRCSRRSRSSSATSARSGSPR